MHDDCPTIEIEALNLWDAELDDSVACDGGSLLPPPRGGHPCMEPARFIIHWGCKNNYPVKIPFSFCCQACMDSMLAGNDWVCAGCKEDIGRQLGHIILSVEPLRST